MKRIRVCLTLCFALLAAFIGTDKQELQAQSTTAVYTITEIPSLDPAYYQDAQGDSWANSINSYGDVVGVSRGSAFYRLSNGIMVNFYTNHLAGKRSDAAAINDLGQVIGTADITSSSDTATSHIFTLPAGGKLAFYSTLYPNSQYEVGIDINNSGQIIGFGAKDNYTTQYGVLYSGGTAVNLGYLDQQYGLITRPSAINNLGDIVGVSIGTGGVGTGFLYQDGVMSPLVPPDSGRFSPEDINDQGLIVGTRQGDYAGSMRAIVYNHNTGVYSEVAPSADFMSFAYGVNNLGHIVGEQLDYPGGKIPAGVIEISHAFLYKNGVLSDLNDLIDPNSGWYLTQAWRINDAGQIIGYGYNYNISQWRAFVLTPPTENTPTGSNVQSTPVDENGGGTPVTLSFSNVATGGDTTLTTTPTGPPPPAGFKIGNPPTYFNLDTTAVFNGPVTVCINYSNISFGSESRLKLLHYENGQWVDATSSLNTSTNVICATVTSFSPFLVVEPKFDFVGFLAPVDNSSLNVLKAGSAIPVKFSLTADFGLNILDPGFPASKPISCSTSAQQDVIEETVTAGSSSLSYDSSTGLYKYVWKTEKNWAGQCRQLTLQFTDGYAYNASFKFTK